MTVTPSAQASASGRWGGWVASLDNSRFIHPEANDESPEVVGENGCVVVLDGELTNRADFDVNAADDASALLTKYLVHGEKVLSRLRGSFSLVVWDGRGETLYCVRDRLGTRPLYYARAGSREYFSTSLERLLEIEGIPSALNRDAVAHRLIRMPMDPEETFYAAVSRVPPGHVLAIRRGVKQVHRYWSPTRAGITVSTEADAVSRFGALMTRAVQRSTGSHETGVMLSGGADSVAVAVAASTRSSSGAGPLALSVVFPEPAGNEEGIQRRVATSLGLRHRCVPLEDTTRPGGPLLAAISQSARFAIPPSSFWRAVFTQLVAEGKRLGCSTILTGEGGDEWLQPSASYAADRFRHLDVLALARLWRAWNRYYSYSGAAALRDVVYASGGRPLLRATAGSAMSRVAPQQLRRIRTRRAGSSLPMWFAPDVSTRGTVIERMASTVIPPPARLLEHDLILALERSWFGLTLESYYEIGQRVGVQINHPLLDDDVLDFVIALPARLLMLDSRVKGLSRRYVLEHLPELGPDWPTKGNTRPYGLAVIRRDGRLAYDALGGATALSDLGLVSSEGFAAAASKVLDEGDLSRAEDVWEILTLEAWVRARC